MKCVDVVNKLPKNPDKQYSERPIKAIQYAVVHHSLTANISRDGDIYAFARYHINRHGWPGIGYHYVIDTDGIIYKTNYLTTKSYHVGDSNYTSIGICLVGDFRKTKPTPKQKKALTELLSGLRATYNIKIRGHSEMPGYSWKKCPALDMDKVRDRVYKTFNIYGKNQSKVEVNSNAEGDIKEGKEWKENTNLLTKLLRLILSLIKNVISSITKK